MAGLLELLNRLEWSGVRQGQGSGPMSSGGDGPLVACCPVCRGINPNDENAHHFIASSWGHQSDCELSLEINSRGDKI